MSIQQILKQYQIKPSKRLGQHFLIDKNILQKIVEAAEISSRDAVLEIGPGIGILTLELAKRVKKVIAVEKDREMCRILKDILEKEKIKNVEIINQDILKIQNSPPKADKIQNFKIVANLPYYIASPVIRKFLEARNQPQKMILMIQKEVAQRITAKPPNMSILAVSVQFYAEPKIITYVSKNSFWPKPKVDSAIIQITPFSKTKSLFVSLRTNEERLREQFFKLVKAGFASPRKQLANNLAKNLKINRQKIENILLKCGLDPKQRAETLSVEDWKKLSTNPLFTI